MASIDASAIVDTGNETVYNFSKSGYTGCGLDGTQRPFEMYYGTHVETAGPAMAYSAYSHLDGVTATQAIITRNSTGIKARLDLTDNSGQVSMEKQANGLFTITVGFSNGKTCSLPVYVNDGDAWAVEVTYWDIESVHACIFDHQAKLDALIAQWDVTPENSLGVTEQDIAYPTYYEPGVHEHRCDTELWKVHAHEIVTDDSLSDTVKVTMLHDWMTRNMAYDHYMVNELGKSRANHNKDWSGK